MKYIRAVFLLGLLVAVIGSYGGWIFMSNRSSTTPTSKGGILPVKGAKAIKGVVEQEQIETEELKKKADTQDAVMQRIDANYVWTIFRG